MSLGVSAMQEHSLRWVWEFGHHLSGRTAIALGIANVYIGLHMKGESIIYYAIYSVLLGAILAVGFSKEVYDGIRSHRSEVLTTLTLLPNQAVRCPNHFDLTVLLADLHLNTRRRNTTILLTGTLAQCP